jgi:hypothetical protein
MSGIECILMVYHSTVSGIAQSVSDSLRAGRPGDRIPVEARFSHTALPGLGTTQPPIQWVPVHSRW